MTRYFYYNGIAKLKRLIANVAILLAVFFAGCGSGQKEDTLVENAPAVEIAQHVQDIVVPKEEYRILHKEFIYAPLSHVDTGTAKRQFRSAESFPLITGLSITLEIDEEYDDEKLKEIALHVLGKDVLGKDAKYTHKVQFVFQKDKDVFARLEYERENLTDFVHEARNKRIAEAKRIEEEAIAEQNRKLEEVKRNKEEAIRLLRQAAEQGHVDAQIKLGEAYFFGKGIGKDKNEAIKWYSKATEQGSADAQYKLGWCYYEGTQIAKDEDEAIKWWTKAKEQGHALDIVVMDVLRKTEEEQERVRLVANEKERRERFEGGASSVQSSRLKGGSYGQSSRYDGGAGGYGGNMMRPQIRSSATADYYNVSPYGGQSRISGYSEMPNPFGGTIRSNFRIDTDVKYYNGRWYGTSNLVIE